MKKFLVITAMVLSIFLVSGVAVASSTAVSSAGASADPTAIGIVDQTFEADKREFKDMPRGFANGTEVVYPGMPNYFGPKTLGPNTIDLDLILKMKRTWTLDELTVTGKGVKTLTHERLFVPGKDTLKIKKNLTDTIDIVLGAPPENGLLKAVIMVRARNTKVTTLEVLADAGRSAMNVPGRCVVYIVAYGSQNIVKTSGWGIGFNSSVATVNGTNDLSSISSGGTGYSSGEGMFDDKPWVHAFVVEMP